MFSSQGFQTQVVGTSIQNLSNGCGGVRIRCDIVIAFNMIVWLRRGNTFIPYAKISGHGFRILAEAMEADLPYRLQCPALLICGEKDHAGSCIRYNKAWHKRTGIPIRWLKNAGHNSNTDEPQLAKQLIADLVQKIEEQDHGCVSGSHQSCNF